MRLDEILNEAWTKEDYRRNEEWNSRHFNAVGPPNGPWYVEDRFALRDKNVAGPFDNKDEAWAEADRRQKEYSKGEVEYWKKGGKGMTMAPINRGSRYESVKEVQLEDGRSRSNHEKYFDKRHPSEVLKYFSNKRTGGKIKKGYEARVPFDDEIRTIESISITKNSELGREYQLTGQSWRGRDYWRTFSLGDVEIYEVSYRKVL